MTNLTTSAVIPEYKVRVSPRAKHVRLKVSLAEGVVVVIPKRFNPALLDDIVRKHAGWIEKTVKQYAGQAARFEPGQLESLPASITLPAVDECWAIETSQTDSSSVRVSQAAKGRLHLSGNTGDLHACRQALRRWLMRHANTHISPLLEQLSDAYGLNYSKLTIRGQRTRWGSCSSSGTISLNYQLLFVSPAMLRYVLVHELCHTVHMNHSRAFHALVVQIEPDAKALELQLHQAWRSLPGWLHSLQAP